MYIVGGHIAVSGVSVLQQRLHVKLMRGYVSVDTIGGHIVLGMLTQCQACQG